MPPHSAIPGGQTAVKTFALPNLSFFNETGNFFNETVLLIFLLLPGSCRRNSVVFVYPQLSFGEVILIFSISPRQTASTGRPTTVTSLHRKPSILREDQGPAMPLSTELAGRSSSQSLCCFAHLAGRSSPQSLCCCAHLAGRSSSQSPCRDYREDQVLALRQTMSSTPPLIRRRNF